MINNRCFKLMIKRLLANYLNIQFILIIQILVYLLLGTKFN